MARTSKAVARTAAPSANIARIDDELANEVVALKTQIGAPSGNKIKVEPRGAFVLPSGQDLGPEIQVVVLDFVSRNFYYASNYNPNAIAPPDCYAMGKDISKMAPEADSPSAQSTSCATCPLNQFGSGPNGAKACKNQRWAAVLVIDPDLPDAHNDPGAPVYVLPISPTSIKAFDGATGAIARTLNGPPIKAILTVEAVPSGTYSKLVFRDPIPNPNYAEHVARRAECQDILFSRPNFTAAPAPARRGAPAAPARRAAAGGARR